MTARWSKISGTYEFQDHVWDYDPIDGTQLKLFVHGLPNYAVIYGPASQSVKHTSMFNI